MLVTPNPATRPHRRKQITSGKDLVAGYGSDGASSQTEIKVVE